MTTPTPDQPVAGARLDDLVWRQIQIMQAAGWQLVRTWPGGADFTSVTPPTISTGVHIILTVFTLGTWLLIWVPMELFGSGGGSKWCRLTVDEYGQAHYQETGPPK